MELSHPSQRLQKKASSNTTIAADAIPLGRLSVNQIVIVCISVRPLPVTAYAEHQRVGYSPNTPFRKAKVMKLRDMLKAALFSLGGQHEYSRSRRYFGIKMPNKISSNASFTLWISNNENNLTLLRGDVLGLSVKCQDDVTEYLHVAVRYAREPARETVRMVSGKDVPPLDGETLQDLQSYLIGLADKEMAERTPE